MDFILGYVLPMLPIALGQSVICYAVALCLGLKASVHLVAAVAFMFPVALFYVALGLLCGCVLGEKQVGGICGALLTNVSAWLSGIWFDLDLVGDVFSGIAYALPFVHAVEMQRAVVAGQYADAIPHLWWVLGYAVVTLAASVWVFLHQSKR
jgi:ABC-2 type transport system permease protein